MKNVDSSPPFALMTAALFILISDLEIVKNV